MIYVNIAVSESRLCKLYRVSEFTSDNVKSAAFGCNSDVS